MKQQKTKLHAKVRAQIYFFYKYIIIKGTVNGFLFCYDNAIND